MSEVTIPCPTCRRPMTLFEEICVHCGSLYDGAETERRERQERAAVKVKRRLVKETRSGGKRRR